MRSETCVKEASVNGAAAAAVARRCIRRRSGLAVKRLCRPRVCHVLMTQRPALHAPSQLIQGERKHPAPGRL